jgi:predicted transposase/invertase (TIGR01784 family)
VKYYTIDRPAKESIVTIETDSNGMAMGRLKILNDFAFQRAFGEKGDETQLLSFLNATLERTGKGNLESVEILESRDLPAEIAGGKSGKLDVLAKLPGSSKVNIEVQIKNQYNIGKRSLYYWSRKYAWDFLSGSDYSELVPVIAINIVDFGLFPIDDFHTSYHLWEDRHKDVMLSDVCEIHFLDMVKFRKVKEHNLEDPLYRWLVYFDEYSPAELVEEVVKMDTAIQLAQDKLEMIARDPELLRAYEQYEKAASDWTSGINGARREGRQEGRLEGQREIARKLKSRGRPADEIIEDTGLSFEEIAKL